MRRSRKLLIGVVLAAVLLLGSLGGVVLADDNEDDSNPRTEFLERLAEKLGIGVEDLQAKIAEVREEMPERTPGEWQGRRGPAGCFGNVFEGLDEDTQAALKDALAQAREEMKGQEDVDHRAVIAGIFEDFGIDIDELCPHFAGDADSVRPFKRGFRGMGRIPGPGGPFTAE